MSAYKGLEGQAAEAWGGGYVSAFCQGCWWLSSHFLPCVPEVDSPRGRSHLSRTRAHLDCQLFFATKGR